jgi:hypothetical protein
MGLIGGLMKITKAQKKMLDTVKKEGELPILAEWKQDLRTARALIKKRLLEVVTEDRRMISVAIPESNEK